MAVQLDDTFFNDLGLGNASHEKKQALMQNILETLELRVSTRLAEDLSDEQLDEFESISPKPEDSNEVVEQKQQTTLNWLKSTNPNYENTIEEELNKLKNELRSSLDAIMTA